MKSPSYERVKSTKIMLPSYPPQLKWSTVHPGVYPQPKKEPISDRFLARFYALANHCQSSKFVSLLGFVIWEASKMAEAQYKPPGLEPWDIVIVVLYFIVILGVGLYVSISLYVQQFQRIDLIAQLDHTHPGHQNSIVRSCLWRLFQSPQNLDFNDTHPLNEGNSSFYLKVVCSKISLHSSVETVSFTAKFSQRRAHHSNIRHA